MDLTELKKGILAICVHCLSIKDNIINNKTASFACYIGGGRQYHSTEKDPYRRTIYLGRDSKRYNNVPEEVIDLNEVYFLYKREKGLFDWEDNFFNSNFKKAINILSEDDAFLIIDYNDIMEERYEGITYKEYTKERNKQANIRFVKLT